MDFLESFKRGFYRKEIENDSIYGMITYAKSSNLMIFLYGFRPRLEWKFSNITEKCFICLEIFLHFLKQKLKDFNGFERRSNRYLLPIHEIKNVKIYQGNRGFSRKF